MALFWGTSLILYCKRPWVLLLTLTFCVFCCCEIVELFNIIYHAYLYVNPLRLQDQNGFSGWDARTDCFSNQGDYQMNSLVLEQKNNYFWPSL